MGYLSIVKHHSDHSVHSFPWADSQYALMPHLIQLPWTTWHGPSPCDCDSISSILSIQHQPNWESECHEKSVAFVPYTTCNRHLAFCEDPRKLKIETSRGALGCCLLAWGWPPSISRWVTLYRADGVSILSGDQLWYNTVRKGIKFIGLSIISDNQLRRQLLHHRWPFSENDLVGNPMSNLGSGQSSFVRVTSLWQRH